MYHNLFDSHSHSENSLDGTHSVTFMVETAIEKGVQGLAITDHCDCDSLAEDRSEARQLQSALDVAMAKVAFRNRIIITNGIELGQPGFAMEDAERILDSHPYDFVLLSIHRLQGWPKDLWSMRYGGMSAEALHSMVTQYFDELLELAKWGRFDILAHLSLPLRYLKIYDNIDIDLRRYTEQIDAILRVLVDTGKGFEINASGLFNAMKDTLPSAWVVRRFRELGGERITVGSDAHNAFNIGAGISEGMQVLKDAGFHYFAFYRAREPVMLRII